MSVAYTIFGNFFVLYNFSFLICHAVVMKSVLLGTRQVLRAQEPRCDKHTVVTAVVIVYPWGPRPDPLPGRAPRGAG